MVAISDPRHRTINAIYQTYEARQGDGYRPHLGASIIGHPCRRYLWYSFRWAQPSRFSGRLLKLFQRGQLEEEVFVRDLRRVGVEVWEVDPDTGKQIRVEAFGGHFGGSMDGVALGLMESPKTPHLLEFKTHNAKSFADLTKNGVEKSKPQHYAQMQVYMGLGNLTRAFYLSVNKDTDELYSERIKYDADACKKTIDRAEAVIFADEPLERISNDPAWFQCKWCDLRDLCHGLTDDAMPSVNCRTCAHSTPTRDGKWVCERHDGKQLSTSQQKRACEDHRFIPALLERYAEVADANHDGNWVKYRRFSDGLEFINGQPPTGLTSEEIAACNFETTNKNP